MSKKKRKKKIRLKKEKIYIFKNKDKEFHEKWTKSRDKMNIPHPSAIILCSVPHCGKTNTVKNLIMRQYPYFTKIVVVHCDPEYTKEYSDIETIMLDEIPDKDFFDGVEKTLVILEDISFEKMSKEQSIRLDRLFGNWRTHKNITVYLCTHDFYKTPKMVRRTADVIIMWKPSDYSTIRSMGLKLGMNNKTFIGLIEKFLKNRHDSLWIDRTEGSPYPLRLNCYKIIKK